MTKADDATISGLVDADPSFRGIIARICKMNKRERRKRLREVLKRSGRESIYTELLQEGVAEKYMDLIMSRYHN